MLPARTLPLTETQTGAIEVGHIVRRRSSRIFILIIEAFIAAGVRHRASTVSVALVVVVGQAEAPVLMRNRASQSAVPAPQPTWAIWID